MTPERQSGKSRNSQFLKVTPFEKSSFSTNRTMAFKGISAIFQNRNFGRSQPTVVGSSCTVPNSNSHRLAVPFTHTGAFFQNSTSEAEMPLITRVLLAPGPPATSPSGASWPSYACLGVEIREFGLK